MPVTLTDYQKVNEHLQKNNIDSILYGSLGVSVYLGNFRDFDDIDLLVDETYIRGEWSKLINIMSQIGFQLADEHEHQFANNEGTKVAFASKNVLVEDNICNPTKDGITIQKDNITINTITPESFIKAYTFSSTDGYRLEKRGDSDLQIVHKLKKLTGDI